MTEQEIFDKVAIALLKQNAKSTIMDKYEKCVYRAPDGKKCAFGHLIEDDEYKKSFEFKVAGTLIETELRRFLPFKNLIDNLQRIHDAYDIHEWKYELEETARRFHLSSKVLETL